MKSWNYRIIKHPDEHGEEVYGIHEVHYKDGKAEAFTEHPIVVGNSIEELRSVLESIASAFRNPNPILNASDFGDKLT